MYDRHARNFCIPNYRPADWWECDLFEITDAGYFREYEVKLSRGDFKADADKRFDRHGFCQNGRWGVLETRMKHDDLAKGDPRGPSRFWYVTPAGLIAHGELPKWAGLIEFTWNPNRIYPAILNEKTAAPRLHQSKVDPKLRAAVKETCYWRLCGYIFDHPDRPVNTWDGPAETETTEPEF